MPGVTGFLSVEVDDAIHQRGHCRLTSPPGDSRFFPNSISLHFWGDFVGFRGELGVAGVVAGDIDSDGTFCCHHPNWQALDAPSRGHKIREKEINQWQLRRGPSRTNPGG